MSKYKIIIGAVLALMLLLTGCGDGLSAKKVAAMIAPYAEREIVISGLAEEEFAVTVRELAALPLVNEETSGARANGQQLARRATGPTLESFVALYGHAQADFYRVRFIATDDYQISIHEQTLTERTVILTLGYDGDPLPESEAPLRVIIPGLEANQWPYLVTRVEFTLDNPVVLNTQLIGEKQP